MVRQNKRIDLLKGDITRIQADAIVNAANSSLLGGGGVDGVIHRKGGPAILEECRQIRNKQGGCPAGEAVITTAGMLPARYVIHTVGPVWNQNKNQDHLLASCYTKSLDIAVAYQLRSIAFPNISTGIYHFPKDGAAAIAVDAVMKFLEQDNQLQKVIFVCFDSENYEIYRQLLNYEQQVKNND